MHREMKVVLRIALVVRNVTRMEFVEIPQIVLLARREQIHQIVNV